MKKEDLEQITTSVTTALIAARTPREPIEDTINKAIAFHEEADEHRWIRTQIQKAEDKHQRWEKLKTSGIFWLFIIVTGSVATVLIKGVKIILKKELDAE